MYGFKVWMKMSAVSLPVLVVRTGSVINIMLTNKEIRKC